MVVWISENRYLIASAIVYALGFLNCIRIVRERERTSSVFAWVLFHISMPVLALPVYYVLGKNRMQVDVRRRSRSLAEFRDKVENFAERRQEYLSELPESARSTYRVLSHFEGAFEPVPSQVELLVDGEATFEAIFSALSQASDYIFVQYYILRSDRLGLELQKILIEKARAGVPVYVLYDDMGSIQLSQRYLDALAKAGVRVRAFLPVFQLRRLFQINFRNHRKLVVVDGEVAFTGGLNVGEEYVGKGDANTYWRDTHVKLRGLAVRLLEDVFLGDWYFAAPKSLKEEPGRLQRPLDIDIPGQFADRSGKAKPYVQVVPSGPADRDWVGPISMHQLIRMAKKRLWVATPYFIPDPPLQNQLRLAALNGVEVKLILPGAQANNPVAWASLGYAEKLLRYGIEVYRYQKGFMHQKVMLVDDELAAIGTCNLDNRALYLNFENTILIHDVGFASQVSEMLRSDLAASTSFGFENRWVSWRSAAARLIAPLL